MNFIRIETTHKTRRVSIGTTQLGKPIRRATGTTTRKLVYKRRGLTVSVPIDDSPSFNCTANTAGARRLPCGCCEEVLVRLPDGRETWIVQDRRTRPLGRLQAAMDALKAEIKVERENRRKIYKLGLFNSRVLTLDEKICQRRPNHFFKLLEQKREREMAEIMKTIRDPKKPVNHRKHVGVELEFVSSLSRDKIGYKLARAGLAQYAQLKGDGSVRHVTNQGCGCGSKGVACTCPNREGNEIAIVAGAQSIKGIVEKVCNILVKDCDSITNKTCGLHVHLDMRPADISVRKAFKNLVSLQGLLYSMVPKSRKSSEYCAPNESGDWSRRNENRYRGINSQSFERHQTLEVRIHSGSLSARKINHWIELLSLIAYSEKDLSGVKSLTDLAHETNMKHDLLAYCLERLMTFQAQHGASSFPVSIREKLDNETYMEVVHA